MELNLLTLIAIIIAYLLGSLPCAVIICKIAKKEDPRTTGSQNPGTTNVLRIAGKKLALYTLLGDMGKGLIAVLIGYLLAQKGFALSLVGLFALIGHIFPIFSKFKGGKGVATGFGVMLGFSPLLGLAALVTWGVIALVFRYSSLAALVAYTLTPFYALYFTSPKYFLGLALMAVIVFWRHKENIIRLKNKTESKIGKK